MDVFDASGSVDSAKLIDYITTSFPGERATLIKTKEELAKRQGAMSAVDAKLAANLGIGLYVANANGVKRIEHLKGCVLKKHHKNRLRF